MAISVESSVNTAFTDVTVLLVDGDSTCLTIISKMLETFGYKVVTAKRASDAFSIIQDRKYKIDLILAECCLPDMDKYELLETIKKMFKLPVILMSAYDNVNSMLGGLFKGAKLYLLKPITMNDLKNLWQFVFINKRENEVAAEEVGDIEEESSSENTSGEDVEFLPQTSEESQNFPSGKRKRSNEFDFHLEEENDDPAPVRSKLIWTDELHARFLQAIGVHDIDGAHPKEILQHMNVPGLMNEQVSSHLQKFHLYLKREEDPIHETINRGSALEHVASHNLQHNLFSPLSAQEGVLQFSDLQSMIVAGQPDINGLIQENLNGHIPFASHVVSNHNVASTIEFGQQALCSEQLCSANPEFGLIDFPLIEDWEFPGGETDSNPLNFRISVLENLLRSPPTLPDDSVQEKQQPVLPEPLQVPSPPQEQDQLLDIKDFDNFW